MNYLVRWCCILHSCCTTTVIWFAVNASSWLAHLGHLTTAWLQVLANQSPALRLSQFSEISVVILTEGSALRRFNLWFVYLHGGTHNSLKSSWCFFILASGLSYQIILIQPLELELPRRIRPHIRCFFRIRPYPQIWGSFWGSGKIRIQTVCIRSTGFITM